MSSAVRIVRSFSGDFARGSMDFRVELSDRAQRDIASIYEWLQSEDAGDAGENWFVGFRTAIGLLTNLPSRGPLAPESRESPVEVRQLLCDRRPHVYRILFRAEGDVVRCCMFATGDGDCCDGSSGFFPVTCFIVEIAHVVVHEGDEPDTLADLGDPDLLPGEDVTPSMLAAAKRTVDAPERPAECSAGATAYGHYSAPCRMWTTKCEKRVGAS